MTSPRADHAQEQHPAHREAADTLRRWALDERLAERALAMPTVAALARKVADRYIAGESVDDVLAYLRFNEPRGHATSVECLGESVRDAPTARHETELILDLISRAREAIAVPTISFDLSHVGSLVSPELGLENALRLAAAADAAGTYVMLSAEGSDRTDLVLDLYEQVASRFPATGVTLQARLHRTPGDLTRVMTRPGPIRLVKGAFLEPKHVAYERDSSALTAAYFDLAGRLLEARHRVNFATHDAALVTELRDRFGDALAHESVEFEMLQGLGTRLLDSLAADGLATREYSVYGPRWWLYVLNRIAEHPEQRVLQALADLS